jgi:hypothetical protein
VAKLRDAERAREQNQEKLRKMGAHAIEVAQKGKKSDYEVVAHFDEEPPKNVPAQLEVKSGGRKAKVPLQAKRSPRFKLE